jgi:hypothetical protein
MGGIYILRSFGLYCMSLSTREACPGSVCVAAHEAVPIPKTPKNKVATGMAGTGPRTVTSGPDLHW